MENTRLRNTLLSLVTSIESNVITNVNNILQLIQQSRITNGLPRNAQLDCLGQLERPETSTPLNSTSSTPAFNIEESTVKESKTNNYGVPQYFKRKSPEEKEESLEKFSTILEQLESDDLVTVANTTTTTKTKIEPLGNYLQQVVNQNCPWNLRSMRKALYYKKTWIKQILK